MNDARANILARLRAAPPSRPPHAAPWNPPQFGPARLERFRSVLESVHAEVYEVDESWPAMLSTLLAAKGVLTLMAAPELRARMGDRFDLLAYESPVEELKEVLVGGADAALTTAIGGIAETGSVVLAPDAVEPRLMSLLPPIHVVLVREDAIVDSLPELLARDGWAGRMPTNLLLVSGPSKTADIEQTLAYGVHGPKELIVLVLKAGHA